MWLPLAFLYSLTLYLRFFSIIIFVTSSTRKKKIDFGISQEKTEAIQGLFKNSCTNEIEVRKVDIIFFDICAIAFVYDFYKQDKKNPKSLGKVIVLEIALGLFLFLFENGFWKIEELRSVCL